MRDRAEPKQGSVEVCRLLAAEIWRTERVHEGLGLAGLNSESAVRDRLRKLGRELIAARALPDALLLRLSTVGWAEEDPLALLDKTEQLMALHRPGGYAGPDALLEGADPVTLLLIRALVLQSIGGRLGRWAVRSPEIPDARTARALYRGLGEVEWQQYRALLSAAEALFVDGRYREAAASLLDADRLVRTAAGLLRATVALTKAGDFISALWAVRAALLEPHSGFESGEAHLRARRIEGKLRAIIEGRAEVPLTPEEGQLLLGEEPPLPGPRASSESQELALVVPVEDETPRPPRLPKRKRPVEHNAILVPQKTRKNRVGRVKRASSPAPRESPPPLKKPTPLAALALAADRVVTAKQPLLPVAEVFAQPTLRFAIDPRAMEAAVIERERRAMAELHESPTELSAAFNPAALKAMLQAEAEALRQEDGRVITERLPRKARR